MTSHQPITTQKLWCLSLPNLHILMSSSAVPYILNLKGIAPAVPKIQVLETRIFFFAPNNKRVCKLCCAPILMNLVHK